MYNTYSIQRIVVFLWPPAATKQYVVEYNTSPAQIEGEMTDVMSSLEHLQGATKDTRILISRLEREKCDFACLKILCHTFHKIESNLHSECELVLGLLVSRIW